MRVMAIWMFWVLITHLCIFWSTARLAFYIKLCAKQATHPKPECYFTSVILFTERMYVLYGFSVFSFYIISVSVYFFYIVPSQPLRFFGIVYEQISSRCLCCWFLSLRKTRMKTYVPFSYYWSVFMCLFCLLFSSSAFYQCWINLIRV